MLLALIAVAAGLAVGLVAGRRIPGRLPRLRAPEAALLGGGLIAAGASRLAPSGAATALASAGYALLTGAAVLYRRHPGATLMAGGLLANLAVTVADGGMPVQTLAPAARSGMHHGLSGADHLPGLGDIIAVPGLGMVASPGDLVISLGAAVAAFCWLAPASMAPAEPAAPTGRR